MRSAGVQGALTVATKRLAAKAFRPRRAESRKGENGIVCVVGGSALYHGAPFLAASGALRSGVDLVYLAVPRVIATAVRALSPNLIVMPLPDVKLTPGCVNRLLKWLPKVDALVLGPGLGKQRPDGMQLLVRELCSSGVKILLDADALVSAVVQEVKGKPSVITPHAGEFKRVFDRDCGSSEKERAEAVREQAALAATTILLKGPTDVISDGARVVLNRTGTPAMTVGGTGDVLSGLVAGLMSKGAEPMDAAIAGAYANGLAGERAAARLGLHITATDVLEELPPVLRQFDRITG